MEQRQRGRYGCRNFGGGRGRSIFVCQLEQTLYKPGLPQPTPPQVSTVPRLFRRPDKIQAEYSVRLQSPNQSRVPKITFRIVYEDGTKKKCFPLLRRERKEYMKWSHTIDASRVVQKIYMYVGKGVSMYLYDIQLTEGNKAPTGYITAEEDVQAQIEQVKLDVDYIASDSSLTPSDKQQVANEWARIQGEYWSIMANAEKV